MTTCTYIGGGEGCTQAALEGRHYCEVHYALVYRVGSGVQRRKDTAQAARVRLVEQLLSEAVEELTAEGFDLYGDTAMVLDIREQVEED
jgi:hypothetical protein